jgi:Beta-lactamase
LLKRESLDQMWSGQRLASGNTSSFGLGWVVGTYRGRKTVGHSGGPALSDVLYFPDEKLAVIVQTNQLRLYPHFAQGIADLLLPPPPVEESKGIQDNNPKITQTLRTILENAARESFDFSLFTEEAQKTWLPELKSFASVYFGGLDPLNSFVLIEDKAVEGKRVRRYRTRYGTKSIIWTFTLDQNGRVAQMEPKTE